MNFLQRIWIELLICCYRSTVLDRIVSRFDRTRRQCNYDIYCMSGVEEDVMGPTGVSANVLVRHDGTVEITNLSEKLMFHDEAIIELRPRRKR